jgi:hypothetical protein
MSEVKAGLTYDSVEVGADLGAISYAMTEEKLESFRHATGDPGALYPTIATKDFFYLLGNRYQVGLMLHAKHESFYQRPPAPGIQVHVTGRVVDKYVRRGRAFVVVESLSQDGAGQVLVRSRTTFLPLAEPGAVGRDGDAGEKREEGGPAVAGRQPRPIAAGGLVVGEMIGPIRRRLTPETMEEFERCSELIVERPRRESIHVNPDLARQAGQSAPVASGMHSVAHLGHLLRDALGESWTLGGHIAVNHVKPLHAGDELSAQARMAGVLEGTAGPRLAFEVWCEDDLGNRTTVGTADVALDGKPT